MTLTPERIADMREALDADPDLDSVTSRRTTFLALLDAADKLARLTVLLEPLRPLEAAATPGPWTFHEEGIDYGYVGPGGKATVLFGENCEGAVSEDNPDGRFLAAARNALAEMLRVVGS